MLAIPRARAVGTETAVCERDRTTALRTAFSHASPGTLRDRSRTLSRTFFMQTLRLLHNICPSIIIEERKRCTKVITEAIGGDANDGFFHVLEVVSSVLRVEKCVRVDLDQVTEGLLIVKDNGIAWGRGVVAGKPFSHRGSSDIVRVENRARVVLGQIVERLFIMNGSG